ncbi:MAG: DUF1844 domain-containing protein [Pyrinomonadaceae bacterium]
MIGPDDNQEEVTFKVADKRKFNSDGSVREGVTLDAPKPAVVPENKPAETPSPGQSAPETIPTAENTPDDVEVQTAADGSVEEEEDFPGAEDPASFVNFLSTLATNAAASLGAVPHPATGQRSVDLETGKYWLDVLAMLRDKTKGNLHAKEAQLFEGLLADLRMQYVTMVRATEEKLKAQAAQKFTGADILGKK